MCGDLSVWRRALLFFGGVLSWVYPSVYGGGGGSVRCGDLFNGYAALLSTVENVPLRTCDHGGGGDQRSGIESGTGAERMGLFGSTVQSWRSGMFIVFCVVGILILSRHSVLPNVQAMDFHLTLAFVKKSDIMAFDKEGEYRGKKKI